MDRRSFLVKSGAALVGSTIVPLQSCQSPAEIKKQLSGPNRKFGHMLLNGKFPNHSEEITTPVVIVGGGISGLSAARQLSLNSVDYVLLELENQVGGNSSKGSNSVSSYPLGAHYLPLPGKHDPDLIAFLKEVDVITNFVNDIPVYNEYYLCFDPKERLYINNHWQEGIIPQNGILADDQREFVYFHELIRGFKELKGADGKEAFCIPLSFCSNDPAVRKYDKITFKDFITKHKLKSPYLLWYLNYCFADDFGGKMENISAWAGIHYFSSRKHSANQTTDLILTWPEGNGWLVEQLKKHSISKTISNSVVYNVTIENGKCIVDYFDGMQGVSKRLISERVIMATPQFVNQRILSGSLNRKLDYLKFKYAPWMVANLTCSANLENKRGEQLSWDNVIYGSNGLGYVNANHQNVNLYTDQRVLSYYYPLTGDNDKEERQLAYKRNVDEWYSLIINDLNKPHPEIDKFISDADIWIWGHGMIRPSVGFISEVSALAQASIENKILFTHTDTSGVSIFEEAFYLGTQAARKIIME